MNENNEPNYISLRWRLLVPAFIIISVFFAGAYSFALNMSSASTPAASQAIALLAGSVVAVLLATFFYVSYNITRRTNRITATAQQLAQGQHTARTNLPANDEIGQMAQALDNYADYVQEHDDQLRQELKRNRREINHLVAVLEAIPDGVVILDIDGSVILINDIAKKLLGSTDTLQHVDFQALTALFTDTVGVAILPGIYTLGDPRYVSMNDKILSAQAAKVTGSSAQNLGTVIIIRDMTEEILQQRAREKIANYLEHDIQSSLLELLHKKENAGFVTDLMLKDFTRELRQNTVALQNTITNLRDITHGETVIIQPEQEALLLERMVWAIANEWRQIAQASGIEMRVMIQQKGLYVLGDERRIRWALGNLIDNAIKYTPANGTISLEIIGEENGMAHLRIRDNGTGINLDDLPHIYTRFFRGKPCLPDGNMIRIPGMGQGLYITRQIVLNHGGTIQIKSKVNVGTAVYVSLPLTASEGYALPYLDDEVDGETIPLRKKPQRNDFSN